MLLFKSMVVSSYYAFEACKREYEPQGYEVIASPYASNDWVHLFDNEGTITHIRVFP